MNEPRTSPEPSPAPRAAEKLTDAEGQFVVAQVTSAQFQGLPLVIVLRAIAKDRRGDRTGRAIESLADSLERGERLDAALDMIAPRLPSHLVHLMRQAAVDSNNPLTATLLVDYVAHERDHAVLRREVRLALGYPLSILLVTTVVTVLVPSLIMQQMFDLYRDFELRVPQSLMVTAWIGQWGPTFLAGVVASVVLILIVMWFGLGRARFFSLFYGIPLVGTVWRWLEISRWARALQLLLESSVPLPDALRTAADTVDDWALAESTRAAAASVAKGQSLADALDDRPAWPPSAVTMIRWGELERSLPDSLAALAEIYDQKARQRSRWFRLAFPSVVFLMIAHCVLFSYGSVLQPIIHLISLLT